MTVLKTRISATVSHTLAKVLDEIAKNGPYSKSALIEMALKKVFEEQMLIDAEKITSLEAKDLPTEDDWLKIQSEFEN